MNQATANTIHPSAVIDPGVELDGVTVGPYCVLRRGVRIKKGSVLYAHVYIEGDTEIGEGNQIFPFASIGAAPQDLKYKGEPSRVRIGNNNIIREAATVHRGTQGGIMETRIGNQCLLMAYSHVAHDCVLEDRVILANSAGLAGHVTVEAFATLGGMAGVHQFCRVGTRAFLSAGTMVAMDVPPFCTAEGRRAGLVGINSEGLRRAGYDDARVATVRSVYKEFYRPGLTKDEALAAIAGIAGPDAATFSAFVKASQRGVLRPRRERKGDDE